jgi:hypothetical protein
LVISKTIFDANNDPRLISNQQSVVRSHHGACTDHKFVKTTPKPRATKKSNGELLGPPPPPLLVAVLVAALVELVAVDVVDDMSVDIPRRPEIGPIT